MEAADHEAVAAGIGEGEREALVAAGVLERVVPNETNLLDRSPGRRLQDGRPRRKLVELAGDDADAVQMGIEDGVETPAVLAAGQAVESAAQPARQAGEVDHEDEQQERRDREADDGRSDDRGDGGVQVDR